jgi:hypothetical protein
MEENRHVMVSVLCFDVFNKIVCLWLSSVIVTMIVLLYYVTEAVEFDLRLIGLAGHVDSLG